MKIKCHIRSHHKICAQLWKTPQINWDGRLFGCCANHWQDYGVNVFKIGLEEALKTAVYANTKRMLLGEIGDIEGSPCLKCHHYVQMKNNKDFLKKEDIE